MDFFGTGEQANLFQGEKGTVTPSPSLYDVFKSMFLFSSDDSKDMDVLGCHYLLFAVGPLVNGDISYHGSGTTKTASNSTICIEECGTYQRNISYR